MSIGELERLVCTAVISTRFRHKLLNGSRAQMLDEFELTAEEREFLLSIQAETVQEFATSLLHWLKEKGGRNAASIFPLVEGPWWQIPLDGLTYVGRGRMSYGNCRVDHCGAEQHR